MFGRQSIDFGVDSVDGGSVGEIDGGAEIVRVVVLVFAPHDQFKVIGTAGFGGQGKRDAQHKITYGARSVFESNARRGVATFVVAGKVRRIAGRDKAGDPGFVHLPFESTGYDFFLSGTFDVDDGGGAGRPGLPRVARDHGDVIGGHCKVTGD